MGAIHWGILSNHFVSVCGTYIQFQFMSLKRSTTQLNVCVCVCQRERDRKKEIEKEKEKEKERDYKKLESLQSYYFHRSKPASSS